MGRRNIEGKRLPIAKHRDTAVICAKTAEPIKMLFMDWVGPRKHVLDGAHISHAKGAIIRGKKMPGHA